jgi:hypothetical protein
MAGGPVAPVSAVPVSRQAFRGTFTGSGANSKHEIGLAVQGNLSSDAVWRLRFPVPVSVPPGFLHIRLTGLSIAQSNNVVRVNVKWNIARPEISASGLAMEPEGVRELIWGAGDNHTYKTLHILLDAVTGVQAGDIIVVDLTFEASSSTINDPQFYQVHLVWLNSVQDEGFVGGEPPPEEPRKIWLSQKAPTNAIITAYGIDTNSVGFYQSGLDSEPGDGVFNGTGTSGWNGQLNKTSAGFTGMLYLDWEYEQTIPRAITGVSGTTTFQQTCRQGWLDGLTAVKAARPQALCGYYWYPHPGSWATFASGNAPPAYMATGTTVSKAIYDLSDHLVPEAYMFYKAGTTGEPGGTPPATVAEYAQRLLKCVREMWLVVPAGSVPKPIYPIMRYKLSTPTSAHLMGMT